MTGIEAISNAVPVFKPVEWKNARTTLGWMVGLLIAMFVGIVALVELDGIVPQSGQTVLSQLAHRDFGSGPLYVFTQAATALVLLLAANTSYNDFPRVLFLLARDRLAPSRYLKVGDRLAFNNGIVVLSVAARSCSSRLAAGPTRRSPSTPSGLPRLHSVAGGDGRALVARA
jgi:amino acid transporter